MELTSQLSGQGGITEKLNRVERRIARVTTETDQIRDRIDVVHERVEHTGLPDAGGVALPRELDALPDLSLVHI